MVNENCRFCGQALRLGTKHIGKTVRCPRCENLIKIQKAQPTPPAAMLSNRPVAAVPPPATDKQIVTCRGCDTKMAVAQDIGDALFRCPTCQRKMRLAAPSVGDPPSGQQRSSLEFSSAIDVLMAVDSSSADPKPNQARSSGPKRN